MLINRYSFLWAFNIVLTHLRLCPAWTHSEKSSLEKSVQVALSGNQVLQMDCKKLELSVSSLQRERDHERDEKEAAVQERDRAKAETLRV